MARVGLFLAFANILQCCCLDLVYFNSTAGVKLLKHASHDGPFWSLISSFETELPGGCGPTTAVMVLNALASQGVVAPVTNEYSVHFGNFSEIFHYWEQHDINASQCAQKATTPWKGSLEQVGSLISCGGPAVKVVRAAASTAAEFRQTLRDAFEAAPVQYVTVNFDRRSLEQAGFGHHSPIGAYDENTDKVLLLDVARYKYPPVWVGVKDMFAAMSSSIPMPPPFPSNFTTPRGYLVVSMPPHVDTTSPPETFPSLQV
eukprot:TRINITY_DN17722_c0_g1_i3.p1 TRINITY_DN17722_c0_g1~~TRINITY_DN17722_c0_g1_i3.p1  ORF type:complete len:274 (+),score=31.96 TRINITY_DN17722_c0_g1_i3:48-824(+)